MRIRDAVRIVLMAEHLRRTVAIALVVGTVIAAINHADVTIGGDATATTWTKVSLTYLVPFVVSNLGLLTGKRTEAAREARWSR